jgi:predicted GTPase
MKKERYVSKEIFGKMRSQLDYGLKRLERIFTALENAFDEESLKQIKEYCVRVIVVGPVRVGKSSLINAIFEWDGKNYEAGTDPFFPETELICPYRSASSYLVLYDTPGINDTMRRDADTLEKIRKHFAECDLILFLLPYEYQLGFYEKVFEIIIESCGIKVFKDHSVLCVTHSDLLRMKLRNARINTKNYTLTSYLKNYANTLNENIFARHRYSLKPADLMLVSISNDYEIDDLVIRLLEKVNDKGFWGLVRSIKKKRLADRFSAFKRRFTAWSNKALPAVMARAICALFGV